MKNKLPKTLLSFIFSMVFIMAIPFAAHADESSIELIPSPDGNTLVIYNRNPGELVELLRRRFGYEYTNIKVIGKMNDRDFRLLSSSTHKCKSIDLSDVEAKNIPNRTFCAKYYLEKFIFPPNLETIEYSCFGQCYSLKTVILPQSLKSIGGGSFVLCENLELTVPSNIKMGRAVFYRSPKVSFAQGE